MDAEATVMTVMTQDPVTVKPTTLLSEVIEIFEKRRIHHLPVVDGDRKVVGIISTTDIKHVQQNGTDENGKKLWVKDRMVSDPIVLSPDDTLGLAADMFLSRVFHAAPVVEDGDLVGIVTSHDLLREAYASSLPREIA
jgi:predicted transcriptional regulator